MKNIMISWVLVSYGKGLGDTHLTLFFFFVCLKGVEVKSSRGFVLFF